MFFIKKEEQLEQIKVDFAEFFQEIPTTGFENKNLEWFSTDMEKRNFSPSKDISYNFNRYGYRCTEFTDRKKINVLTIGCSMTFGNAIPESMRFSKLICKKLGNNVADWNMAWPGASGDYCSRIISLCFDKLKPDLVLVNFPHIGRLEYFDCDGKLYDHRPLSKAKNEIEKRNKALLNKLSSEYQSIYQFLKNYKLIEKTVQSTPYLFSIQIENEKSLHNYLDKNRFVQPLKKVDVGRDGGHPGTESHKLHAESYFKKIEEVYSELLDWKN